MARDKSSIPLVVRLTALVPVVLVLVAAGGLVIMALKLDHRWPFNQPRPTLIGVTPVAVEGEPEQVLLDDHTSNDAKVTVGRYRIPLNWAVGNHELKRTDVGTITVSAWRVSPGVPVGDDSDRQRAALLVSRLDRDYPYPDTAGPAVSRTLAGQPAVEVASGVQSPREWNKLNTYVFVDRTVITVSCVAPYGGFSTELLQACAAVAASLELTR